jgi:hypothetical protein
VLAGYISDKSAAAYFPGNFAVECPGGHAAAGLSVKIGDACETASALGARNALVGLVLLLAWAALHYYLASRTVARDMA